MKKYIKLIGVLAIIMILTMLMCFMVSCSLTKTELEFNINGKVTTETYKSGMTMKVPSRVGYTFTGWIGEDGELYGTIDDAVNGGNKKLTAQYTLIEYTLKLYTDGGIINDENYIPHYDENEELEYYTRIFTIESNFNLPIGSNNGVKGDIDYSNKKGLVSFIGWYESLNDVGFGKEKVSIITGTHVDVTLYAYINSRINGTTINVYGQDQNVIIKVVKIDEGDMVTLSDSDFELEGYRFGGFYINKTFKNLFNGEYIAPSYDETINVWIKWIPKTYNINYYDISGDLKYTQQACTGDVVNNDAGYSAIRFDDKSYIFLGWQIKTDNESHNFNNIMPPNSIDLYPKYSIRDYTITWNVNGTKYTRSAHYLDIPEPPSEIDTNKQEDDRCSYIFVGWKSSSTSLIGINEVTENVTYTAYYSEIIKKYNCMFYNEDIPVQIDMNVEYGTKIVAPSITPQKEPTVELEYVFSCWKYDSDGDDILDSTYSTNDVIRKNIKYYAVYTSRPRHYVVTWDLNNGTNTKYKDSIEYNSSVSYATNREEPTKAQDRGYNFIFKGWSVDGINVDTSFVITKDTTILALYDYEVDSYSYVYYNEDSLFAEGKCLLVNEHMDYVPYITTIPQKASTAQYDYEFNGWYYDTNNDEEVDTKFNENDELIATQSGDIIILRAQYNNIVRKYTVTYRWPNSGLVETEELEYGYVCEFENLVPFSQLGYRIIGWSLYPSLALPMDLTESIEIKNNITLYAVVEKIPYSIQYELNGGTKNGNLQNIYYVDTPTFVLGTNVSKQYYNFDGWYTEETLENKITYVENGSTKTYHLYAKWVPVEYTITYFIENGQNNEDNPNTYNIESEEIVLKDPTRTGYYFRGWFLDSQCESEEISSIESGSHSNISIYAKWEAKKYTITLQANYAENIEEDLEYLVSFDSYFYLEANAFTRPGYTIVAWNYVVDEETISLENGRFVVDGNRTLKAVWDYANYNITYVIKNGENNPLNVETFRFIDTITLYPASKSGYDFKGWYLDEACSGTAIETITPNMFTQDITLYAKFGTIVYNIQYVLNGGTNNAQNPKNYTSEDAYTIYAPTKEHYNFIGWIINDRTDDPLRLNTSISVGTTGNLKFEACWEPMRYNINYTFVNNIDNSFLYVNHNNEESFDYGSASISLTNPSLTGYTFLGWYLDSEMLSERIYAIDTTSGGDIDIFGIFTPITLNVTFNSNGGSAVDEIQVTRSLTYGTLPNPTKNGYIFDGWYLGNTQITSTTIVTSLEDHTLSAHWSLQQYNITYILNGGQNPQNQLATYTIETNTTLLHPTKPGYNFVGWVDEGEDYTIELGSQGDIELEAEWELANYSISYEYPAEAAYSGMFTYTYTINSEDISTPTLDKVGYIFKGWIIKGEDSSTANTNYVITKGSYGDKILVAVFEARKYTIHFFSDYEDVFSQEYNLDGDLTLPTPSIVPNGLEFIGWMDDFFGDRIIEEFSAYTKNLYALFGTKNLTYTYVEESNTFDEHLAVTGYSGSSTNILIPNVYKYNGKYLPVIEIKENAFKNSSVEIVKAHIVSIIGVSAFENSSLEEIHIESVTLIKENAFKDCLSLEKISLQESIEIEANAFKNVTNLTIIFYCRMDEDELVEILDGTYDYYMTIDPTGNSAINAIRTPKSWSEFNSNYEDFYS